jgi:hypothetical protein
MKISKLINYFDGHVLKWPKVLWQCLIHINYIMGALTTFFGFLKGAILIGRPALLWTPSCKMEKNVLPQISVLQFIYMGVELWANHMG